MRSRRPCLDGHYAVALKVTPFPRVCLPSILPDPPLVERSPFLKRPFPFHLGALALGPHGNHIVLEYGFTLSSSSRTDSLLHRQLHTQPHSRPPSPLSPIPLHCPNGLSCSLSLSFSSSRLFHVHSTNFQNALLLNGT